MQLYDFQQDAVIRAEAALDAGQSLLVVSPTGSGKSYMQAELARRQYAKELRHYQTVPTHEIAAGLYSKMWPAVWSDLQCRPESVQRDRFENAGIWTIKRLYNALMAASIPLPDTLSFDEAHHSVDDTNSTVWAMCGHCPRVGFTATAYRGTPEETHKLIAAWGQPYVALRLKTAVGRGIISRPDFRTWPLVNDDTIKVTNGEFVVSQVDGKIRDALPALVERIKHELCWRNAQGVAQYGPLRPTMIRVPSVASAAAVVDALRAAGLPAGSITGEAVDGGSSRQAVLQLAVESKLILVQIKVIGEGVDLPMRVMVDLAPTMSPVFWMQAVGRITRPVPPGEQSPVYIATNHNLTRHAYLWEGLIPPGQIRDSQTAWGEDYKPARRSIARALGIEGFGRFTVSQVPLLDGSYASLYALQTPDGMHLYAVLLHPCLEEPWFFEKTNTATGEKGTRVLPDGKEIEYNMKRYGPWKRISQIPNADGYVSVKPGSVSGAMDNGWRQNAECRGLDPKAELDARMFQALPILSNCRMKFKLQEN